ncbi:hypothetical protein [Chryseobacterium sp.]|jgi:hypothetical protein|uniref:hypothetical protein n=1 Tax=Chryseobacterium sp. TaxID=1871047 RepID=UPI00283C42C4|nr:hypothetical protein [Chryseobacterium sp.]MDR3024308.1 hypothetical protein [Chryseobacterium sp.]
MKKYFQTSISIIVLISCNAYKRNNFEYRGYEKVNKDSDKRFFTKQFKDDIFYKCLKYGYGESLNFQIGQLMAQKDLFSPSDDHDSKLKKIQDSLAQNIINNLPPVYLHLENENEIKGKNFIISTCLTYYESKELNSFAQKLYREKTKNEKKIWGN